MRYARRTGAALVLTLTAGCGSETILQPRRTMDVRAAAALVPLDPFGIGAKVPGSRGCNATEYRQFDFWVGNWHIPGPRGLVATSVIESELDGCLVEENWKPIGAPAGRSLNTYDASTGKWHQFWVAATGCPGSVIVMEGGIDENGSMVMQGSLSQPLGFLFAQPCLPPGIPPFAVFTRNSYFRWTLLPSGRVFQQFSAGNDAPAVPPPPPETGLGGIPYDRVAEVTPVTSSTGSFCPFRAAAQQFDFMIGTWDVHQGNGQGAQGTTTFSKDLNQCLVEEHFEGPEGYEGMSYNTFDVFTQQWMRTYVDNDGQRIFMTGGLQNGTMVLVGTKNGSAGRSVLVRITWDPVEPTRVIQRWEYSRDGGETWQAGTDVVHTKR